MHLKPIIAKIFLVLSKSAQNATYCMILSEGEVMMQVQMLMLQLGASVALTTE